MSRSLTGPGCGPVGSPISHSISHLQAPRLQAVVRALSRALVRHRCGSGALAWLRPEIVDGLSLVGQPGRPQLRVHLAEGWPASVLPCALQTPWGELPLQAWRMARPRAQCATLRGQRTSPSGEATRGTVGFLALDQHAADRYYLVTAGHVLADRSEAAFDDRFDILATPDGDRIGQASLSQTSITGGAEVGAYALDAGLLRVSPDDWRTLLRRRPEALPPRLGQTPVRDQRLQVWLSDGRQVDGVCKGLCNAMNIEMRVTAPDGSTRDQTIRVESLVAAHLEGATEAGDSGAPVRGMEGELLGLHNARLEGDAGEANAWFTPARAAIDYFGIIPVTRETLDKPPAVIPLPSLRAAPGRRSAALAGRAAEAAPPSEAQKVDTLARTLWAEARGEGQRGMEAVACVVMNRVRRQTWWGRDVVAVCRKPWQFSCWNPGAPALSALLKVGPADADFVRAQAIAARALQPGWEDFTDDACHYHTVDILPDWARGQTPCFRLGRHVFYNRIR